MSSLSAETLNALGRTDLQKDVEKSQNTDKSEEQSRVQEDGDSQYLVTLSPEDDPKNLPILKKWAIVIIISVSALCVTCASSVAAFAEGGVSRTFHVSNEVAILGVSLFVQGLGFGPLLIGPLSEVYGRNVVYRTSFVLLFAFSWPVAFPPHIAVYLIFRWITGFCGAAFLSVAGGSVSDLFSNAHVANPMAFYTVCPFLGPVLGPLISGFIVQNTDWRWIFRVMLIWVFVQTCCLLLFVPETYEPVILKRKAKKLRASTGNSRYFAPLEKREGSLLYSIMMSCYVPFKLLALDRMALLLDLWSALLLGILYLAFQAFPIIFEKGHGFSIQLTGLSFLGIGCGILLGLASQPLWNRYTRREIAKYDGHPPPEVRLVTGMVGAVLVPISLYWLAFTTYPHVHWIVPIIASVPFGTGILFCFNAIFTYLVVAFRPIAASAMSANAFVRTTFAAAFPLFAGQMYHRLGTVGATALLAGLTTLALPLPFVFYKYGAQLRATSHFAVA